MSITKEALIYSIENSDANQRFDKSEKPGVNLISVALTKLSEIAASVPVSEEVTNFSDTFNPLKKYAKNHTKVNNY